MCSARCSRSATRSNRSSRSRARRRARSTTCGANSSKQFDTPEQGWRYLALPPLVPLRRERARRRRPGVRRARHFCQRHHRCSRRAAARGAAERRARAGRTLAADRAGRGRKEIEGWDAPFDTESEESPRVMLARTIAAQCQSLDGARIESRRRARPGAPARAAVRGHHPRAEECRAFRSPAPTGWC